MRTGAVFNFLVQEVVHLDPGHPEDCAIQLYNVSQEMMGIWAARYSWPMASFMRFYIFKILQ